MLPALSPNNRSWLIENATVSYAIATPRFFFFLGGSSDQSTKVKDMSGDVGVGLIPKGDKMA